VVTQEAAAALLSDQRAVKGTVLVDGFLAATWATENDRATGQATLQVKTAAPLRSRDRTAVEREGMALVRFLHPAATTHEVRV
jgi:hypothetical protein